jgi:hypothetical protein
MLAATLLGIFLIPALFVTIERLTARERRPGSVDAEVSIASGSHAAPARAE